MIVFQSNQFQIPGTECGASPGLHRVDSESATSDQPVNKEKQQSVRGHYQVRAGDSLQSISRKDPLMNDIHLWDLIAQINNLSTSLDALGRPTVHLIQGAYIILPSAFDVELYRLRKSLSQINQPSGLTALDDFNCSAPPDRVSNQAITEVKLDDVCRLLFAELGHSVHKIELQTFSSGQWMTAASYDCGVRDAVRHTYRLNGARNYLKVDLPAEVSEEMATEDFRRNWRFYIAHFHRAVTP